MKNNDLLLLDGDIILYRSAFACKEMSNWSDVKDYIWKFMTELCNDLDTSKYIGFLQGKGNFRNEIATQAEYKGNRKSKPKPFWFFNIRQHLMDSYDFHIIDGMETDDALTILHNRLKNEHPVICSIDKDLLQSPGKHYNFNTQEMTVATDEMALYLLATQIIVGDSTDNIKGLHRIGPKKAEAILANRLSSRNLDTALAAYVTYYTDKEGESEVTFLKAVKHFAETFELVYLLRELDEEKFPTPVINCLYNLENPLEYGAGIKNSEESKSTIFD